MQSPISKQLRLQAGFSMLEVLFALVLLGMVLVGIAVLMTRSLVVASNARYREIANGLAQEVVELYHRERTLSTWEDFRTEGTGNHCVLSDAKDFDVTGTFVPVATQCAAGAGVTVSGILFQRLVEADTSDLSKVGITVTVSWKSGRGGGTATDTIVTQQEFTNWL
ncbi:MAG: prepilin-type N-terminal cleavage/methylation domain-containing protein [bacterium]|nr:prepilin-type N-terminal cleavage/methylation domain-containing protein [bacterium]